MLELENLIKHPDPEIFPQTEAVIGMNLGQYLADRQVQEGLTHGTTSRLINTDYADYFPESLFTELTLKLQANNLPEGPVAPALRKLNDFKVDMSGQVDMKYRIAPMNKSVKVIMVPDIRLGVMRTLPNESVFALLPPTDKRLISEHELEAYAKDKRGRGSRSYFSVNYHITNIIFGQEEVGPRGRIRYTDPSIPKGARIETIFATHINHRQLRDLNAED